VSIPRQVLTHLGWLTGSLIVLEVLEDDSIRLRKPSPDDFAARGQRPVPLDQSAGLLR
jgi:hypothetical protein